MKKALFCLLLVMFALSGCGNSDQYAIERDFWKVNKQAQAILKNPLATPLNEVERVVSSLQKFSDEHRENILAVRADLLIGKIYLAKGMYEQARAQFENVSKNILNQLLLYRNLCFLQAIPINCKTIRTKQLPITRTS